MDTNSSNFEMLFDESKERLRNWFGIDNLSTIEMWHLKKYTEEYLPQLTSKKGFLGTGGIEGSEVVHRFLYELYGIQSWDISDLCIVNYWENGKHVKQAFGTGESGRGRELISKLNNKCYLTMEVSEEGREYIARIRERATWPEKQ